MPQFFAGRIRLFFSASPFAMIAPLPFHSGPFASKNGSRTAVSPPFSSALLMSGSLFHRASVRVVGCAGHERVLFRAALRASIHSLISDFGPAHASVAKLHAFWKRTLTFPPP